MFQKLSLFILIMLLCKTTCAQQASYETFGQNRVQFRTFDWQYYDTANFRVFYYDYGKFNAQYILQQSELDLPLLLKEMNMPKPPKLNIIIYNSFDEYKQTNIGKLNEAIIKSEGGLLELQSHNIAVYFDGTHKGLRHQVRKGIANVLKDNMLYGTTLKEIAKNAVSMNLPNWFTNGYVAYISNDWTSDETNTIKSIIETKPKLSIIEYAAYNNDVLLGKSYFNYLKNEYGEQKINELLQLASKAVAIEKAIPQIIKKPYKEAMQEWKQHYCPSLEKDSSNFDARNFIGAFKIKENAKVKNFSANPDGSAIAFSEEKDGMYNIKLYEVRSEKIITIIEGGFRSSLDMKDPNYPIICWSRDGKKLAMVYEKDYKQRLKVYDARNAKISNRILNTDRMDRIHSMCFMEDDEKLVVSAIKKGQSNLYQLTIKNARLYNLTKDVWDDINPQYISGRGLEGILFFSNRTQPYKDVPIPNNELPNKPYNLYYYNLAEGQTGLITLVKGNTVPLSQPIQYGSEKMALLVDEYGYKQRFIIHLTQDKKGNSFVNYTANVPTDKNILYHAYNPKKTAIMELLQRNGKIELYETKIAMLDTIDKNEKVDTLLEFRKTEVVKAIDKNLPESYYLSEFVNNIDSLEIVNSNPNLLNTGKRKFRSKPYIGNFYLDYLQTSVDNSLLFNRYQKIDQGNGNFQNPPWGALLQTSLVDVMEDHKITAAVKIPDNFVTLNYLLKYGNYKKRLDWEISFFHNADTFFIDNSLKDTNYVYYSPYSDELAFQSQNVLQANLIYPFSTTTSIQFTSSLRQDKLKYKSRSEYSLRFPIKNEYWWFNRWEYIFDNTRNPITNIYKGTRYKFYTDVLLQLSKGGNTTFNHGVDFRHYIPLYKNIILANRFSGAVSYGSRPFLHTMGGIDNEIIPAYNTSLPPQDTNVIFGYRALATNLRGYKQNAGNGSNFFVINEELRIPITNTLTKRTIKNAFLRELQLVTFFDMGATWTGFNGEIADFLYPVNNQNSNSLISTTLRTSGLKYGYGYGVRTKILGYYLRADIAWGIDSRMPRFHLSTTHDF